MNETQARDEICRVGKSLFDRGYVHSTAGNISVKLEDAYLITPTDACLGFLEPEALAKVDFSGRQLSGARASKTLALHTRIYEACARANIACGSVIHTHSAHCVAATLDGDTRNELLPPITPYFVMKVGHVPLVPYRRPGDPKVADDVAQLIARHAERGIGLRAVMLSRLGPNVWHETPAQAMAVLEELEETAKLWALRGRSVDALDEEAIDELRKVFGAQW
jgi:ribulose-5-phosphate 4-epimerase/fuculose-1-phosphate aldolase